MFRTIQNLGGGSSSLTFAVISGLFVLNAICCFALLQWKQWGFYGILMTAVAVLPVTISTDWGVGRSVVAILGVVILIVLLNRGGDEQLWRQLE
ncbi:MAG: hypothetical protein ABI680_10630 [Chthoniobacteraceae bacterium]